jgi:Nucleotidyl transferase of unknown function (DUF2204)
MNIQKDFEEFLKLLHKRNVEYVVVGGYAVAFHGYVRATKDIDILFNNSKVNIRRLKGVLNEFGFPADSLSDVAFSEQGKIIRMGVAPVMIELINAISGVSFKTAWKNRIAGRYGKTDIYYLSKSDLLKNKKASGRPRDILDIDELKRVEK